MSHPERSGIRNLAFMAFLVAGAAFVSHWALYRSPLDPFSAIHILLIASISLTCTQGRTLGRGRWELLAAGSGFVLLPALLLLDIDSFGALWRILLFCGAISIGGIFTVADDTRHNPVIRWMSLLLMLAGGGMGMAFLSLETASTFFAIVAVLSPILVMALLQYESRERLDDTLIHALVFGSLLSSTVLILQDLSEWAAHSAALAWVTACVIHACMSLIVLLLGFIGMAIGRNARGASAGEPQSPLPMAKIHSEKS